MSSYENVYKKVVRLYEEMGRPVPLDVITSEVTGTDIALRDNPQGMMKVMRDLSFLEGQGDIYYDDSVWESRGFVPSSKDLGAMMKVGYPLRVEPPGKFDTYDDYFYRPDKVMKHRQGIFEWKEHRWRPSKKERPWGSEEAFDLE